MPRFAKGGMALAFALALFPLLLVLGLAFMSLSGADYGFSGQSATRIRAFYLADAGARYAYLERGRWRLLHTEDWSLATGEVRLRIEPRPDATTAITSVGRSGWVTIEIQEVVDYQGNITIYQQRASQW